MSRSTNGLVGMRTPSKCTRFLTEEQQRARLIREGLALVIELETQLSDLVEGSVGYRATIMLLDSARSELSSMGARFPRSDRRRARN